MEWQTRTHPQQTPTKRKRPTNKLNGGHFRKREVSGSKSIGGWERRKPKTKREDKLGRQQRFFML